MIDSILFLIAIFAAGFLFFLGVLMGIFAIWSYFSKKTLDELRDEGFYD